MTDLGRYLLVAAGSAVGGCARYAVGNLLAARVEGGFPFGTFVVNATGCFVIGFLLSWGLGRAPVDPAWRLLVATGFCGGYTTFSAFAWETVRLAEGGNLAYAAANVAGSAVAGLLAVLAGSTLARAAA